MTHTEINELTSFPNALSLVDFQPLALSYDENRNPLTFELEEDRVLRFNDYFDKSLRDYKDSLFKELYESKLNAHFKVDGGVPWLRHLGDNPSAVIYDMILNKDWETLNTGFLGLDALLEAHVDAISLANARQIVLDQISSLEAQITPRRIREVLLSGDNSFISSIEAQIAVLRASL